SEIFPNAYRGAAISVVGFWNSVVSSTVTMIFPWELSHFGVGGTFLGYGLLAGAAVVFVLVAIPETKGKSLEELELLLTVKGSAGIKQGAMTGLEGASVKMAIAFLAAAALVCGSASAEEAPAGTGPAKVEVRRVEGH